MLRAVPRASAREAQGIDAPLPFSGVDLWTAWELTWLDTQGKPVVATATFAVGVTSPNIIESKSLKLYLNSLANTAHSTVEAVEKTVAADLARIAGDTVRTRIERLPSATTGPVDNLPGTCIDDLEVGCSARGVDTRTLCADPAQSVREALHTHLLRSLCPVTGQPDIGSLLVRYRGPRIDREGLLQYLISFREHDEFHEACVERIFVDLKRHCGCQQLTVYARYNRRGGIDINPFRSDFESPPENRRLWRQ